MVLVGALLILGLLLAIIRLQGALVILTILTALVGILSVHLNVVIRQ
jgi:hypothetical protein